MKHALHWIALSLLLAACGTPSSPALPDGRQRRPINTAERIDSYSKQLANAQADSSRLHRQQRRIDDLETQIAALRGALALRSTAHDTGASGQHAAGASTPPLPDGLAPNETMRYSVRSLAFSVPFAVGDAVFSPSMSLRRWLLPATDASPHIEIRGRTDADACNRADQSLALRRAAAAREFLIRQGIAAARVHVSALACGDHAADNATTIGKALNRRVEIEAMDIDPQAIGVAAQTTKGEGHESD